MSCEEDVAKVSVVGAGVSSNPGVAAKMFEALSNAGINTDMVTTFEIRITCDDKGIRGGDGNESRA